MKGTAFAFIALAIAMFLFNFFAENNDISGGETGLRVSTPNLLRTAPFYLLFVSLAFIVIAAFIGMIILYLKDRKESSGFILFIPIAISFPAILLFFEENIIGPIIVIIAFLGMIVYYWIERKKSNSDPLRYSEEPTSSEEATTQSPLISKALPIVILIIALIGVFVTFGNNVGSMVSLWFENSSTFYYTIPVQYYLVLTCLVITYSFMRRLVASPFGRMVIAIAQNEERAEALGYNSYHTKIVVVVLAGAIAGLAGALYAPFIRTIDPTTTLGVEISIDAMLFTILGGLGTLLGPILGAGIVEYSNLYLVEFITGLGLPGEIWLVVLGVIYIFIVLFMPLGIIGSIKSRARPLKEKLQRLKIGRYEFGIKESDYWVFAFLGIVAVFLLMLIISL
jgi:ABC-type branched-subunit amino acid transport system permease subunit